MAAASANAFWLTLWNAPANSASSASNWRRPTRLAAAGKLYESFGFQQFEPDHLAPRCDRAYFLELPRRAALAVVALLICCLIPQSLLAQGTKADYLRAVTYRRVTTNKVTRAKVDANWFDNGNRFWYRNDLAGGKKEFVLVDAVKGTREVVTEDALPKGARKQRNRAMCFKTTPHPPSRFARWRVGGR